jgi:hypothetical protein
MVIELESIGPHLEAVAEDGSNGVDHRGQWPSKIFAAKYRAVEGASLFTIDFVYWNIRKPPPGAR